MRRNKVFLSFIIIFSCSVSIALGFVIGNSNLGPLGYPRFTDTHYHKPSKPYSNDEYSVNRYKQEVENYINAAKNYVEASNNDIQRIREEKDNAISEANSVVNEYNRYLKYGY